MDTCPLVRLEGTAKESESNAVKEWTESALKAAFESASLGFVVLL